MRAKMPADWKLGDNPWQRYRAAGLDPDAFVIPAERLPGQFPSGLTAAAEASPRASAKAPSSAIASKGGASFRSNRGARI